MSRFDTLSELRFSIGDSTVRRASLKALSIYLGARVNDRANALGSRHPQDPDATARKQGYMGWHCSCLDSHESLAKICFCPALKASVDPKGGKQEQLEPLNPTSKGGMFQGQAPR